MMVVDGEALCRVVFVLSVVWVVDAGIELVGVEEVVGVMDSLVVDSADVCMDEVMMVVDGEALCRVVFVLSVVWMVDAGIELVSVEEVVGVMDSLVVDSADVCMDEVSMVVDGEALCRVVFVLSVVWVVDAGIELVGVEEVVGIMDSLVVDSADVCMDEVNMVVDGEALCRVVFVLSVVWMVDAGSELVGLLEVVGVMDSLVVDSADVCMDEVKYGWMDTEALCRVVFVVSVVWVVDAGTELVGVEEVVGVMDSLVVDSADVCMDEVMMVVDGEALCRVVLVAFSSLDG